MVFSKKKNPAKNRIGIFYNFAPRYNMGATDVLPLWGK